LLIRRMPVYFSEIDLNWVKEIIESTQLLINNSGQMQNQSGYTAPTNTSEYYYGNSNTPAGGNGNGSSGTNPQPTAPPSASSQGYTSRDGYEVSGYSSGYEYGNYPTPATSGNFQAGPGSSGGSTTQQYNSSGGYNSGTNKTGYSDRDNDYGEGPGYGGNKNPYGDNYGGNYKSRENNREGGYGPSSKDGASYDNFGNHPEDGSVVQKSTDTVYISNLSKEVTEEKLADYF
ncbi:1981_t:CDS:2, partial [Racocetra fulgida]